MHWEIIVKSVHAFFSSQVAILSKADSRPTWPSNIPKAFGLQEATEWI